MNISPVRNYVFFKSEKKIEDTLQLGSQELFFAGDVDHLRNARIFGKVVAVPKFLDDTSVGLKVMGKPAYASKGPDFRKLADITPNVEVGDTIYFHYSVLGEMDSDERSIAYYEEDGTPVYMVRYDQIWARKNKRGHIQGVGTHIVVKPDMESWEDIIVPTYGPGRTLLPKDKWIQVKVKPEAILLHGVVEGWSDPYSPDVDDLKKGDRIIYRPNANFVINIDGTDFFVMKRHNIYAKYRAA